MLPPTHSVPLPPMPAWLRLLGVGVCIAPLIALLVSLALGSKNAQELIGGIVYIFVIFFVVILLLIVPVLAPPICWGLGWRPGALACSGYLILVGLGFLFGNSGSDRHLSGVLLLHVPLVGLLTWEWRAAIRRRQKLLEALRQSAPPI